MKSLLNFLSVLIATFVVVSCNSNVDSPAKISTDLVNIPASADGIKDTTDLPAFTFVDDTYDFGLITQGEKISFHYKFKNSGKSNLIITSAKGSCGCTVPDYPKKPIPPGEEGEIEVVFDSSGKSGKQNKSITIHANTYPVATVLHLTGEITAPGDGNE